MIIESLLSRIDRELETYKLNFARYVDDYEVFLTDENEKTFIEHESKLNGTVQICSMIIAMSDIAGYRNPSFSSDYKGFGFNIEKGCVMGIGKQINIDISKEKDNLENTSSIFSIIPIMKIIKNIPVIINTPT